MAVRLVVAVAVAVDVRVAVAVAVGVRVAVRLGVGDPVTAWAWADAVPLIWISTAASVAMKTANSWAAIGLCGGRAIHGS